MVRSSNRGIVAVAAIASMLYGCSAPPPKYRVDRRSVDELVDDVSTSTDEAIKVTAAQRLGELEDRNAEFALLLGLRDPAPAVRGAAVKGLVELKDPAAVEPLCNVLLKDIDRQTRIAAAWALARFQDPRAVRPLAYVLQDLGESAASALGALGPIGVAPLVNAVSNAATLNIAGTALISVGEPAVGPLIQVLQGNKDKYARAGAAHILAQIGGELADNAVREALKKQEPEMVAAAYRFLIRSGQPGTESLLVGALDQGGDLAMATDFTNSGNEVLKSAAAEWAAKKHYVVPRTPADDEEIVRWGKALTVTSELAVFHFDNSLSSTSGIQPSRMEKTSFVPGKWGSALAIAPGGILAYPITNNLDLHNGTIEMWIAPRFEGADPIYAKYNHALLIYNLPNADHFVVAENSLRSFYAGSIVGKQFTGAGGGDMSSWRQGRWHHVAFTYSTMHSRQRWYIDGLLTSEHIGAMPAVEPGVNFAVDSDFWGHSSAFLIDELRILNEEERPTAVLQSVIRTSPFGSAIAPTR